MYVMSHRSSLRTFGSGYETRRDTLGGGGGGEGMRENGHG